LNFIAKNTAPAITNNESELIDPLY